MISILQQVPFNSQREQHLGMRSSGRPTLVRVFSRLLVAAAVAVTGFGRIASAFPKPGNYFVWVQAKHAGRVLTGVFPVKVEVRQP